MNFVNGFRELFARRLGRFRGPIHEFTKTTVFLNG